MVEVHEAELADWGLQVEVDDVLLADALQVLAVTHPAQVVDYLLVARDLEAVPEHRSWIIQSVVAIVVIAGCIGPRR